MVKKPISLSLDKEVRDKVEFHLNQTNEKRKNKHKKEFTKSDYYQNLIVIGLIIETNKKEDIPKILENYFEEE